MRTGNGSIQGGQKHSAYIVPSPSLMRHHEESCWPWVPPMEGKNIGISQQPWPLLITADLATTTEQPLSHHTDPAAGPAWSQRFCAPWNGSYQEPPFPHWSQRCCSPDLSPGEATAPMPGNWHPPWSLCPCTGPSHPLALPHMQPHACWTRHLSQLQRYTHEPSCLPQLRLHPHTHKTQPACSIETTPLRTPRTGILVHLPAWIYCSPHPANILATAHERRSFPALASPSCLEGKTTSSNMKTTVQDYKET